MGGKHNQGKILSCLHCGKEEYIPPYRLETYKFCSRNCSYHYKEINDTVEISCAICSTKFNVIKHRKDTAKYCSRSCYYKSLKNKGSVKHNCLHCGKEFFDSPSVKRKYCSKQCINKSSKETFNPSFNTVRTAMRRRDMIESCNRCGYSEIKEILGVHHKDRNRKNNSLDNLEVLCPMCHSLEHRKHIAHGFKE